MARRGREGAERRQADYYAATAGDYERLHVRNRDEHAVALRYIAALSIGLGCRSALDVGAGTGRGLRYLREAAPGLHVVGVEPVQALVDRAVHDHGVPPERMMSGRGEALPFPDAHFDVVFETGVLHHVPDPSAVVAEMLRVARIAVFLSDDNRFAGGPFPIRAAKLIAAQTRIWPLVYRLRTRGRGYRMSETDGLAYSYSVYDSLGALTRWGRTFAIATETTATASWIQPLTTSQHVLMCSVRE
jgi:SAM-dependent methyltransferase